MLSLGYARYNDQDFNKQQYQGTGNLSEAMGRGKLNRRHGAGGTSKGNLLSQNRKTNTLMPICGIQKNDTDELIFRAVIEMQTQRMDLQTWEEGEGRIR